MYGQPAFEGLPDASNNESPSASSGPVTAGILHTDADGMNVFQLFMDRGGHACGFRPRDWHENSLMVNAVRELTFIFFIPSTIPIRKE